MIKDLNHKTKPKSSLSKSASSLSGKNKNQVIEMKKDPENKDTAMEFISINKDNPELPNYSINPDEKNIDADIPIEVEENQEEGEISNLISNSLLIEYMCYIIDGLLNISKGVAELKSPIIVQ